MDNITPLAAEVAKLSALLNDKHPGLKSWRWLVEHQSIIVVNLLIEANLLDGDVDDQD